MLLFSNFSMADSHVPGWLCLLRWLQAVAAGPAPVWLWVAQRLQCLGPEPGPAAVVVRLVVPAVTALLRPPNQEHEKNTVT